MKVLHVIPSLGPARGGPSVAVPAMARALGRRGLTVDVVATDDNGPDRRIVPLAQPICTQGVTIRYFPRQTHFYTFSWPLTTWLTRYVSEYDVAHIHALFSYASTVAAWAAARAGVPYIVRPLGTLNHWGRSHRRPILKMASLAVVEHRILAGASAIHYTSGRERDEAADLDIRCPSAILPLGIDDEAFDSDVPPELLFRAHPPLRGRDIVLFVGRLDPIKGLDILLDAFAGVHRTHPNAALVIAGDGDAAYATQLRSRAQQLNLNRAVTFTGRIDGQLKAATLAAATAFILPSHSENFGIAAAEALATGIPTIVSDQVGIAADIRAANAGIVCSLNSQDMARAIELVLAGGETRYTLAREGRRLARERYSTDAAAVGLIDLYKRVSLTEQRLAPA